MVQKESERTKRSSSPNPIQAGFAAMGGERVEEFVNLQTKLLNELQETNRQWLDRAQSEANLASEFAAKLTAARSIPEAMAAYQEWASRRFAMMAEDGKHLLGDTQKFMEVGARLLSSGSIVNDGKGGGT